MRLLDFTCLAYFTIIDATIEWFAFISTNHRLVTARRVLTWKCL